MELKDFSITEKDGIIIEIDHNEYGDCPFWDISDIEDNEPSEESIIRSKINDYVEGKTKYLKIWSDNDHEEPSNACYIRRNGGSLELTQNLEQLIRWINESNAVYVCHVEDCLL